MGSRVRSSSNWTSLTPRFSMSEVKTPWRREVRLGRGLWRWERTAHTASDSTAQWYFVSTGNGMGHGLGRERSHTGIPSATHGCGGLL